MSLLVLNSFSFILRTGSWNKDSPGLFLDRLLSPFGWLAFHLPAASSVLTPHQPSALQPQGNGIRRWTCPRQSCASTARRAGRTRLEDPKAAEVYSLQLLHISLPFLSEGLGSKRNLSQLQLHHNRLQLHLLPAQAARKEPSRAVPSLSPEKGWPELHWLHNSCCQHHLSRGMSEACSEVAPAQQTHSFCRLQHSHLPCFSSRVS